jgi:DHA1 family multidrug resistance protein-like MFS transporter
MSDIIREAPLGQAIRWLSGNKLLQYLEERADFELPIQYAAQLKSEKDVQPHSSIASTPTTTSTPDAVALSADSDLEGLGVARTKSRMDTMPYSNERFEVEQQLALERMYEDNSHCPQEDHRRYHLGRLVHHG